MLRISSGLYKGRVLRSGGHTAIRPTMARVKLCLFDILQEEVREAIMLDGFAGSGQVGIEALSRGAEYVVFVDELPEACNLIRHNLEKIGILSDHYRIICGDFNRSVIRLAHESFCFDLIFLDPPYEMLAHANPLRVISKRGILRADGQVILERSAQQDFSSPFFRLVRSRRLGREQLDFYALGSEESSPA